MAGEASQRESWWVLQAQSGSHEALNELFKSVQELLLISTVSCYSIVGFGLLALGAHIDRGIARLLKALELGSNVG